jgi:hypothetical protein
VGTVPADQASIGTTAAPAAVLARHNPATNALAVNRHSTRPESQGDPLGHLLGQRPPPANRYAARSGRR